MVIVDVDVDLSGSRSSVWETFGCVAAGLRDWGNEWGASGRCAPNPQYGVQEPLAGVTGLH